MVVVGDGFRETQAVEAVTFHAIHGRANLGNQSPSGFLSTLQPVGYEV